MPGGTPPEGVPLGSPLGYPTGRILVPDLTPWYHGPESVLTVTMLPHWIWPQSWSLGPQPYGSALRDLLSYSYDRT